MGKDHSIEESINKIREQTGIDSKELAQQVLAGDRVALARAITLLESTNPEKRSAGQLVLDTCMPNAGRAKRIGITGVPGVGKSTFIEAFGLHLIEAGHKVAVLAIDPTSQRSGGSILGDKTRMEQLSGHDSAFVRPSPAGTTLGGVAARTRESILLCEAAGYDIILVETVGVGQSETSVHSMVDFFLLLMLAGAGDELQGIKRGIMEMADLILINKADGSNMDKARKARAAYIQAVHLFPPRESDWTTGVYLCSAQEGTGIDEAWEQIADFFSRNQNYVQDTRRQQNLFWLKEAVSDLLQSRLLSSPTIADKASELEEKVATGQLSPYTAAEQLINFIQGD